MSKYHKIAGLYARKEERPFPIIEGQYSSPELEFLKDVEWVYTEKVDGTNIRVIWDGNRVTFGGKTDNAAIPAMLGNRLNELFGTPEVEVIFEQVFGEGEAVLYGEGFGARIQKGGGNYSATQDFVLFDVRVGRWWLRRADIEEISDKFGIPIVPIVARGTLEDGVALIKGGLKSTWGDFDAEGIVGRPAVELFDRSGQRIIVKIKKEDFKNLS